MQLSVLNQALQNKMGAPASDDDDSDHEATGSEELGEDEGYEEEGILLHHENACTFDLLYTRSRMPSLNSN